MIINVAIGELIACINWIYQIIVSCILQFVRNKQFHRIKMF